jgi:N-acetyl-1-D-myo-inositol-2-amino-2-deoxy-alpha-D-glucopyranoside deacetylase
VDRKNGLAVQRMLAVFAHPDDECLVAGGTLKACSERGLETIVISLTRGEQGSIAHPNLATRETLGTVRESELRAACERLGVTAVECFDYPDGSLAWADATEIESVLSERIEYWQPEIIITFGPEGLYWHPDHIAVYELTKATVSSLQKEGFCPCIYYATFPDNHMTELAQRLESRGLNFNAWGLNPKAFGSTSSTITTCLDVRQYLDAKLDALNCHRTQFGKENLFASLPRDLAKEFLGWEFFVRANPSNTDQDKLAEIIGK